jgi:hypothetical protein
MADEIIRELWEIKDNIAREYGYDLDALVNYLKTRQKNRDPKVVDLQASKKSKATT